MKVYGLKKCSTCQKALTWMADQHIVVAFVDHQETPPSRADVAKWSKALGGWEKMINRAGYTWRGLDASETADLDEARAVALAVKSPSLIRRPLIEYADGTVSVGFSDKTRQMLEAKQKR
jgi:arsenate reductase (glutaredoxin)